MTERYRIDELIGAGAHGSVSKAWDRRERRVVAVKLAPVASTPEIDHRFLQEGRLRFDHPNVMGAIDTVRSGGRPGIVMEFGDGGDLANAVDEHGRLGEAAVLLLASELLAGLDHVHSRGVMHRDIKPANVMLRSVDGRMTAALADFGATLDLDGPRLSVSSTQVGTIGFIAPEVMDGSDADEQSDLYSVGRTLEYALTGSTRIPVDPDDITPELGELLRRLLAADPRDRPRSAATARRLIEAAVPAGAVLPGSPLPTAPLDARHRGRGRSIVTIGAAAITLVVAILVAKEVLDSEDTRASGDVAADMTTTPTTPESSAADTTPPVPTSPDSSTPVPTSPPPPQNLVRLVTKCGDIDVYDAVDPEFRTVSWVAPQTDAVREISLGHLDWSTQPSIDIGSRLPGASPDFAVEVRCSTSGVGALIQDATTGR